MDLLLLIGVAVALLVVLITLYFLQNRNSNKAKEPRAPQHGAPVRIPEGGAARRAQIARNQRNRLRPNAPPAAGAAAVALDNAINQDEDDEVPAGQMLDDKMGTKKRAKLEAKEQKRLVREQEIKLREERKAKDEKEAEERKRAEEREEEAERKQAEVARLAREERERKEYEEYLKMKESFSVEEEGFEEGEGTDKENLLADFIQYIKDNKAVVIEDLAIEFKIKTQQAIDRIQELRANGTLTGVIDDRGKFIYISEEELLSVAKFIKQRGRVSIAELAECSNKLINLTPVNSS